MIGAAVTVAKIATGEIEETTDDGKNKAAVELGRKGGAARAEKLSKNRRVWNYRSILMTSDLDIYRSASVLVKHHGKDAPIHAAMRADAMLEAGDLDGYAVWRRVLRAVEELQGTGPKSGEAVH